LGFLLFGLYINSTRIYSPTTRESPPGIDWPKKCQDGLFLPASNH